MLSIIYPYRNRDFIRIKNSLESLKIQSCNDFEVYFVDYGSHPAKAQEVRQLCESYDYISYTYYYTQYQPWNKCKALNSVIKKLETEFCFVADVDMIFHPHFVATAISLQKPELSVYFKVAFTEEKNNVESISPDKFSGYRLSDKHATGLSMFPVGVLKKLQGFDEFYHFWGAEDSDMHVRLRNAGYNVEFYDEKVLMLHQWHPSFRSAESRELSQDLQLSGIVQLNHQHLKHALEYKTTSVNHKNWGDCMTLEELNELEKAPVNFVLDNEKRKIDHLLYVVIPEFKKGILKFIIQKDSFQNSSKFRIKKLMRKKVPEYYSLKEINDKILLHLISFYRNRAYYYKISDDLKSIQVAVKFNVVE